VGDSSGGVLTASRPTMARSRRTWVPHSVRAWEGGTGSLTRGTQPAAEEREEGERRVSQPGKRNEVGRAQMYSDIFDLFKIISN
jgi:hypothetical protein